jgi:2,4-dienoyl-CoA reductase (NADPH2)
VPGKGEFSETLRYFHNRLCSSNVTLRLSTHVNAEDLLGFDSIVLATGIRPRSLDVPGSSHSSVVGYQDILHGRVIAGDRVVIIGGGGIGFDVAEFLCHKQERPAQSIDEFLDLWGIDKTGECPGGLLASGGHFPSADRKIAILQRRPGKPGGRLGKTTGWVLRLRLEKQGVELLGGAKYLGIDDQGLHTTILGNSRTFPVDTIVVCAGQEPECSLAEPLKLAGKTVQIIGGAAKADSLDAKRAIREGLQAAIAIDNLTSHQTRA